MFVQPGPPQCRLCSPGPRVRSAVAVAPANAGAEAGAAATARGVRVAVARARAGAAVARAVLAPREEATARVVVPFLAAALGALVAEPAVTGNLRPFSALITILPLASMFWCRLQSVREGATTSETHWVPLAVSALHCGMSWWLLVIDKSDVAGSSRTYVALPYRSAA